MFIGSDEGAVFGSLITNASGSYKNKGINYWLMFSLLYHAASFQEAIFFVAD